MKTQTNSKILADRKSLIAAIAQRHAAERNFLKSVSVKPSTDTESRQYEIVIAEEFEALQKSSTYLK